MKIRIMTALLAAALGATNLAASQATGPGASATDAAAMQEFERRTDAYLKSRAAMIGTLAPLAETSNAAELAARKNALAAAIGHQRKQARVGDLIPPAAAGIIRREVTLDLKTRPAPEKQGALEEVPRGALALNAPYPPNAAMATVPPLLLYRLPRLPEALQYRFYGRHIILLDSDAAVVLDYVPDVLPPH